MEWQILLHFLQRIKRLSVPQAAIKPILSGFKGTETLEEAIERFSIWLKAPGLWLICLRFHPALKEIKL